MSEENGGGGEMTEAELAELKAEAAELRRAVDAKIAKMGRIDQLDLENWDLKTDLLRQMRAFRMFCWSMSERRTGGDVFLRAKADDWDRLRAAFGHKTGTNHDL